ncbi:kif1-binding protein [Nannochloropsis gaditana]|uniref:KIF-binding protein n=1 Tax=Nannochloropsis gaditana TaxID=72520 RepID=W7TYU7_9STRA|nr:kif1-binding protein [Nannochloropsis gaditana]
MHLSKACDIFFPGLSLWVESQVADAQGEEKEGRTEDMGPPGGVVAEPNPPLAISNLVGTYEGHAFPRSPSGAAAVNEVVSAACTDTSAAAEDAVEDLNLLGLLWSDREEMGRARLYLLAAKAAYRMLEPYCPSSVNAAATLSGTAAQLNGSEEGPMKTVGRAAPAARGPEGADRRSFRRPIDGHHTHTLYYLAQVYGALRNADASASYCYQTLARQLEWELTLDVCGWVGNCMSLVDYLLGEQGDKEAAAWCLEACDVLLRREEEAKARGEGPGTAREEARALSVAGVHRKWAVLYASILEEAAALALGELDRNEARRPAAFLVGFPRLFPSLSSPSSPLAPDASPAGATCAQPSRLPLPPSITSFAQARPVFLQAQKHLAAALSYFVLDGHVTEHVHLLREQSKAYRDLAVFESDDKRRQAMFLRRAGLLQPLLDDLNPRAYAGLLKVVSFELGEVYLTLLETKAARVEEKLSQAGRRARGDEDDNKALEAYEPSKAEAEKCDTYCRLAIAAFEHFVRLYHKQSPPPDVRETSSPGLKASGVENVAWDLPSKEDFKPVFRAHFHLARLYGRMHVFGGQGEEAHEGRVAGMKKSLATYEWLRGFAREHICRLYGASAGPCERHFAEELKICDDMSAMLPEKIAREHFKYKASS